MMMYTFNILVLLFFYQLDLSESFSFDDPDSWVEEFPNCGGRNQSPINIDLRTVTYKKYPNSFTIYNENRKPYNYTLCNDGMALKLSGNYADGQKSYLSGGPFGKDEYEFDHVQFIWSASDDEQSGHQLADLNYQMETHWIHFKQEYGTLENAKNFPDGIVIVGGLWAVKDDIDETALTTKIVPQLVNVSQPNTKTPIEPFTFSDLEAEPDSSVDAYLYFGSETVPPCAPATWAVLKFTYYLTSAELSAFRAVTLENGANHNMRPVQPLEDREIYQTPKVSGQVITMMDLLNPI
ncbi:carbonic anhydrase 15-like [Chelonus insularis]|uniref:carbonic anhydrase 15-like n=1 Tax=Chelonus insularis TaxID=460826 RepID=UPI00158ACA67|nr:carbonic anhydrase 15-like [Chelonus insularis]